LILRNLLDNARKFSLENPAVELKTEQFVTGFFKKQKCWRISITDHGLGFSPQNQKWLFKRFSRLPFLRSDLKPVSIPGTGLGLYLSATASRAMGLTLKGQSQGEGKGAQFVLEGLIG
jgi:two-component system sensor histidine kinase VicK